MNHQQKSQCFDAFSVDVYIVLKIQKILLLLLTELALVPSKAGVTLASVTILVRQAGPVFMAHLSFTLPYRFKSKEQELLIPRAVIKIVI